MACAPDPPVLSKETLTKLAIDFCKLDQSKISDDALQARKKRSKPIARVRIIAAVPEEEEERAQKQILRDTNEDLIQLLASEHNGQAPVEEADG